MHLYTEQPMCASHSLFVFYPSQHHVIFSPAGSYAVEGLKPDTLYKFTLAARSEMGLGVYTQPIEARTAQSSKCQLFTNSNYDHFLAAQYWPSHSAKDC